MTDNVVFPAISYFISANFTSVCAHLPTTHCIPPEHPAVDLSNFALSFSCFSPADEFQGRLRFSPMRGLCFSWSEPFPCGGCKKPTWASWSVWGHLLLCRCGWVYLRFWIWSCEFPQLPSMQNFWHSSYCLGCGFYRSWMRRSESLTSNFWCFCFLGMSWSVDAPGKYGFNSSIYSYS